MQLKSLRLSQVRGFEQGEFEFKPGMNLIVGINGAGKSTVLDVLRIMLSQALPKISVSKSKQIPFVLSDIRKGQTKLKTKLEFLTSNIPFTLVSEYALRSEERSVPKYTFSILPENIKIQKSIQVSSEQPLVVFFSPIRSHPVMKISGRGSSAGGQAFSFANSLYHRELRIREFIDWFRAQSELGRDEPEKTIFGRNQDLFNQVVRSFLDNCSNLRVETENLPEKRDKDGNIVEQKPTPQMLIDKNGTTLDIRQLSDGERGMLSLVLDLARRLYYANPKLSDPLQEGEAVVLIDELDLHLHPGWQRDVVQKLTNIFPKCQFIATTHSPQILGEVSPDNIHILEAGKAPYRPDQSLGMDSNWVLRFLMGTDERNSGFKQELERISKLIEIEDYDQAISLIDIALQKYGESAELVRLQTRIDRIKLLGE